MLKNSVVQVSGRGTNVDFTIDDEAPFEQATQGLRDYLVENRELWSGGAITVNVGRRLVSREQLNEFKSIIEMGSGLTVIRFACSVEGLNSAPAAEAQVPAGTVPAAEAQVPAGTVPAPDAVAPSPPQPDAKPRQAVVAPPPSVRPAAAPAARPENQTPVAPTAPPMNGAPATPRPVAEATQHSAVVAPPPPVRPAAAPAARPKNQTPVAPAAPPMDGAPAAPRPVAEAPQHNAIVTPPQPVDTEPLMTDPLISPEPQESKRASYLQSSRDSALFVKSTCHSGEIIRHQGDVVVLGDVNPGAEVLAKGDIAVFGSLRGFVHAGAEGNTRATIVALNLDSPRIQIGPHVGICSKAGQEPKSIATGPLIAYVRRRSIHVAPFEGRFAKYGRGELYDG